MRHLSLLFIVITASITSLIGQVFVENLGQLVDTASDPVTECKYYFQSESVMGLIKSNGLDMAYWKPDTGNIQDIADSMFRVNMNFYGTDAAPAIIAGDTSDYALNFYLPQTDTGLVDVRVFGTLQQAEIYTGIDLAYMDNEDGSYTMRFLIDTNSAPDEIQMQFSGQDSITLDAFGNLEIHTKIGSYLYPIPDAWQETNTVNVSYSRETGDLISFNVLNYDESDTLFIEIEGIGTQQASCPDNLVWATHIWDGTNSSQGGAITAMDYSSDGDIYLFGYTINKALPVTPGLITYIGFWDVWSAKFGQDRSLKWLTYYGTSNLDYADDIAFDGNDFVYVCGGLVDRTGLVTKTTTNQWSSSNKGKAYFARFREDNGQLDWATTFGKQTNPYSWFFERVRSIEFNGNDLLFTGYSDHWTGTFPLQDIGDGSYYSNDHSKSGFVGMFQITSTSISLDWCTFFGNGATYPESLVVWDGGLGIVGRTYTGIPLLRYAQFSGAYLQLSYGGGATDGFIAVFEKASGGTPAGKYPLLWSTYVGGNSFDYFNVINRNSNGDFYVAGHSSSTDLPTHSSSTGNYNITFDPDPTTSPVTNDLYLNKFNSTGVQQWMTYYGGNGTEVANDITFDGTDVYIVGYTSDDVSGSSNTFPTTPKANWYYQTANTGTYQDNWEAFILQFNENDDRELATLYGGYDDETFNAAKIVEGNLICGGQGNSKSVASNDPDKYPIQLCDPGGQAFYHPMVSIYATSEPLIAEFRADFTTGKERPLSDFTDKNLTIWPNPTNGNLIKIQGLVQGSYTIKMLNALGQIVQEDKLYINVSSLDYTINIKPQDGLYHLSILNLNSNDRYTVPLLILR